MWTNAYPELLDSDALKLTKMILVDQNENNWIALTSNLWPKNARYGTALARLFNWHKIDRILVIKLVSRLHTAADIKFCDKIANWLYAFTTTIENEDQEHHYIATLSFFVVQVQNNPGAVNPDLIKVIKTYLTDSFLGDLTRVCHCHYVQISMGFTE